MPRILRRGGRLMSPSKYQGIRGTSQIFGLDARGILKIQARYDEIERAVEDIMSVRTAKRIGDFGKRALAAETRAFAKNPTGALEKSWRYRSRRKNTLDREIVFSSPLPYARIHDRGGTIRPKKARALAVPVTPIARRVKGGPRRFPGRLRSSPQGLRDLSGRLQYVWKQSVRIPGTGYIRKAFMATKQFRREEVRRRLRDALRSRR